MTAALFGKDESLEEGDFGDPGGRFGGGGVKSGGGGENTPGVGGPLVPLGTTGAFGDGGGFVMGDGRGVSLGGGDGGGT